MREQLKAIGCTLVHERIAIKRTIFKYPDSTRRGYARVRQDQDGVSMTIKTFDDPDYPEETEISIKSTYEGGIAFMKALGVEIKAVQESFREKWTHPLAHEITFDTIPGIPTYMEIDCNTEANMNILIDLLQVDRKNIRTGAYDKTYNEYYGIPLEVINDHTPRLTFGNIINEITPTKNRDTLYTIHKSYG